MVQKEVTKKTRAYGLIGLLLAILLVAMIYSYGGAPQISPSGPLPQVSPSGETSTESQVAPMATFTSYEQLRDILNSTNSNSNVYFTTSTDTLGGMPVPAPAPTVAEAQITTPGTKDYSTTNIQVAGVDEADTVKTDGKYLYVIGNNSQVVYIVDANPQNAKVLAKIWLNNTYLSGVYLSSDGNKLAVLGTQYLYNSRYILPFNSAAAIMPYYASGTTFVNVYNIANKANPVLTRNFTISGNYVNSRMIGDYIYDIITENAYVVNGTAVLPTVFTGNDAYNIAATRIYYANGSDTYYSYTTIVGLNIMDDSQQPTNMTIMMGSAGTIYVSQSNIYVTYPITEWQDIPKATTPASSATADNETFTILPMPMPIIGRTVTWQGLDIYRIHISDSTMTFAAKGNVTGTVLSQYSMDEYNGYFRIATTSYDYNSSANSWSATLQNNLYILNSDLQTVGKIENLASGETMHSARFMGDRCYLVTFNQVDPLFVVDVSQPTNPQVLGNLTIPGYSDFLQPYDATHLIGIGQEVDASIDADKVHEQGAVYYTAILGLKISLFDVSDVANPKEISKVVIGDRGTTSEALSDPKALLFDASRNLMVLPVQLYLLPNATASTSTPAPTVTPAVPTPTKDGVTIGSSSDWFMNYPQLVWQGAYIFEVSVDGGIVIKGNVTQLDNAEALLTNPELLTVSSYQYLNYNQFINREVYIGNVLYTFSDSRIQLNSLTDYTTIAQIDLN